MRKLTLGLLGAAALGAATGANAAVTIDPGTTVPTAALLSGPGGQSSFDFSDRSGGIAFTEIINFTNSLSGVYSITLGTAQRATGGRDLDFFASAACPGCGIWLSGGSIAGALQLVPGAGNNDVLEDYSLQTALLGSGSYTLTIVGRGEGSFDGVISFGAIPEPATWGMMLLGFGAMGYAVRRRRRPALPQIA